MQKPFLILWTLLIGFSTLASSQNYPTGARAISLANAFCSISDTWSAFHNQAGLAEFKIPSAGIFHESRFLIDELSLSAGTLILPDKNGNLTLSFYQFGKGTFKEHKFGLAYSKQLSENFYTGLQLDYFSKHYPENEKAFGFATFEFGVTYQLTKQLTVGTHIFNPIKKGIKTNFRKEKSPYIFRFGGHYSFSNYALIVFESQKTSDQSLIVKSGLEINPYKNLAFRIGVFGNPMQLSSGFGYKYKQLSTDIAFRFHQSLGITPSISIQFELNE